MAGAEITPSKGPSVSFGTSLTSNGAGQAEAFTNSSGTSPTLSQANAKRG